MKTKSAILVLFLAAFGFCACDEDKDGEGGVDPRNDPFEPWSTETKSTFEGSAGDTDGRIVVFQKVPGSEKTENGLTFADYKMATVASVDADPFTASLQDGTVTAAVGEDGTVVVSAVHGNGIVAALTGLDELTQFIDSDVTLDKPIQFNPEAMAVGETTTDVIGMNVGGMALPMSVTYGPIADNLTVETPMGQVDGCRQFHGQGSITAPGYPLSGLTVEGDGWYSEKLGLVAVQVPDLGIDMGMSSESDYGNAEQGVNVIRKTQVLTAANPNFTLSTYDRKKQWDADKEVHAKMLLEYRWADPADAKTKEQPHPLMCQVTFGTMGGQYYFAGGDSMVESPVSIFFPEENGKGYRYWYGFVDQAAKNQPINGISYDIIVKKDVSLPDLRVTARIAYTLYTP